MSLFLTSGSWLPGVDDQFLPPYSQDESHPPLLISVNVYPPNRKTLSSSLLVTSNRVLFLYSVDDNGEGVAEVFICTVLFTLGPQKIKQM